MIRTEQADPISVVVNYFNPKGNPRVDAMTLTALHSLRDFTVGQLQLIVSDGSGVRNDALASTCQEYGWEYYPSESTESFAEAYNRGMTHAKHDYRAWMANDVLVCPDWDAKLIAEMKRTGADMASPYLSSSDYPAQIRSLVNYPHTFSPTLITFNLNIITRRCYEKLGGMAEELTGSGNDHDYQVRMHREGMFVIIADAGHVTHIGKATLRAFTNVHQTKDRETFDAKHPDLVRNCQDDVRRLTRSRRYFWLRGLAGHLPNALRWRMNRWLSRREPKYHRL